ncbi:lipopolysaccharide transport periplasmic protein LptA [Pseudoxanthomonas dokdonensis]|uniref:Lipopolysaccharide export system protein LptA n=1 Tax=Pseudoxanthomonas dokdonensis TaxID=344882 RepID=A0A0R0CEY0_9GAMM|nr:lipopolysaccharide transport periplasmic protein LptA [Pseudoxanthomonas dokdonensis]KRG67973.1 hypothetical protein ABB29_14420 [Pseudoxanthomonas dokdonensis]
MNRTPANAPLLLAALILMLLPALAMAKSSDRNQAMEIESDHQSGVVDGDGSTVLSGNVALKQGTLDIKADKGEIIRKNGDLSQAIFTGSPVTMKQQLDDGSPMTAVANRVEYDLLADVVTFIGDYTVKSPKGSNSGQKMVYDLKSGNMQSGGDGSRVRTVIQPKKTGGN